MDAGTASQPFYSWEANQSTGIFNPAVNNIGFSTNGIERFRIPFGNMVWAMGPGSAAFPFYSWESHRGTGIYKPGGDNLGFSTAGNTRMIVNDNGNVGINTSSPTQKLHLAGNMRLQGAFMPNNNPGQVGSILTSNGSNSSPTWGYKIKRFISSPHNISSNSRQLIYFDSPGLNRNATIIANVRGDWPSAPKVSIDYVEVQANRFILAVSNNTGGIFGGGTNYENMDFNIMIIEWN